ncbi:MAG: class I tRNA ligase family protein [Chiayiivirga sp.]|nr:class I tRNA ligase family protein [Chiayiivirga sp.]
MLVGDHVSAEEGTGAVHTAPGHGRKTSWSRRPTV